MASGYVRIRVPSRVHFGLTAMTMSSSRRYGGAGLSLWRPHSEVTVRRAAGTAGRFTGLPREQAARITDRLRETGLAAVDIDVTSSVAAHVGLGSGTGLALACLEGAARALGVDESEPALVHASRRGGASGVGVNTYFRGGLVGDVGHLQPASRSFLPSSCGRPASRPALAFRLEWPARWPILVGIDPVSRGLSGPAEADFFDEHTPLPRWECAEIAMALFFELPAAVADQDFAGLRHALCRSRSAGFKAREIAIQPSAGALLSALDRCDAVACTMSSFGPAVFAACAHDAIADDVRRVMADHGFDVIEGEACSLGRLLEVPVTDRLTRR